MCVFSEPGEDTLASLWYRYFATGQKRYVTRIIEGAIDTGDYYYNKERQQLELEVEKLVSNSSSVSPKALKAMKDKMNLHVAYFNSLLTYGVKHQQVKLWIVEAHEQRPDNKILRKLMDFKPFELS